MLTNNILKFTNIHVSMLEVLDNFFKKQNLEIKIEIFEEKRNKFFKLKNENQDADFSIIELSAYYSAIQSIYDLKTKITKKNTSISTVELKKYDNFLVTSSKKKKKISRKENFLVNKSSILNSLIAANKSYREISIFLKKNYKMNISHTYIRHVIDRYPTIFKKEEKLND